MKDLPIDVQRQVRPGFAGVVPHHVIINFMTSY